MSRHLLFNTNTELVRVAADAVVYISADGNYSRITTADSANYIITLQLGQVEKRISESGIDSVESFIRIGKSLIVNRDYITYINPSKQKLVLSDGHTFRHHISASKEALKIMKATLDK